MITTRRVISWTAVILISWSSSVAADSWGKRTNIAQSFAGATAVIERADGDTQPATLLIDGMRGDDSAMSIGRSPVDVVITLAHLTQVDAVRIFPGIIGYAGNPSGECGIRHYELHGFVNGGWIPLTAPVTNAPTMLENPADNKPFCYTHRFTPRTIEKVRLRVLSPSDTGCRVSSPRKPIVPPAERVSQLREVEVYAADKSSTPLHHISRLVEGDFRLPVWLNRDQAALWLYPRKPSTEISILTSHSRHAQPALRRVPRCMSG